MTIEGAVDNGKRVLAVFSFYTGQVGVREREATIEAAYFGKAPKLKVPVTGTIDGEEVEVVSAEDSRTARGMTVLTCRRTAIPEA